MTTTTFSQASSSRFWGSLGYISAFSLLVVVTLRICRYYSGMLTLEIKTIEEEDVMRYEDMGNPSSNESCLTQTNMFAFNEGKAISC